MHIQKGDANTKCLLTPPSDSETMQSENGDTQRDSPSPLFYNSALIYSEPAMTNMDDERMKGFCGSYSENDLPQKCMDELSDADQGAGAAENNVPKHSLSRGYTPKSSCFFSVSGSQPSVYTGTGSATIPGHKQSFSTREIREQHMQIQKKYKPTRKRHWSEPIDFEGILNIIGGCSWWQIWVYLLISLQQIPHAMFNLSVVYMMYQVTSCCCG
jgi:hypothetical protein